MFKPQVLGVVVGAVALLFWLFFRSRRARHAQAERAAKLPVLAAFFEKEIPIYKRLNQQRQRDFCARAQTFLDSQRIFYVDAERSADPVEIATVDESLAFRIAAGAATISIGASSLRWATTRDILVYPEAFDENYESDAQHHIAGMVHAQGPIIFSAKDLLRSDAKEDGYNVAIHELVHVLDFRDGYADGTLGGVKGAAGQDWSKMVSERVLGIRSGRYRKLRRYAGTNEAELLAVASEAFFEEPAKLKQGDPELFAKLAQTFRLDPEFPNEVYRDPGSASSGKAE